MKTKEQELIEKQREYIVYMQRAINAESILASITMGAQDKYKSEISALKAEIAKEKDEPTPHVYLIHQDGNTTRLYKDGVIVHPKEFSEFYGCEMTPDQKELLRITKENYFESLKDEPKMTAQEVYSDMERILHEKHNGSNE
jgi:hypothetical protein